ncbi:MAG: ABC transporter permease [Pseudomonadota bacterium]
MNRIIAKALVILIPLYIICIFSGFLAPYHFNNQFRDQSFHGPMFLKIHIFDYNNKLRKPFVYASKRLTTETGRFEYLEDKNKIYPIAFFASGDEYTLLGLFKCKRHLFLVHKSVRLFLLGSDGFGRDIFSRLLYGIQISILISLIGTLITVILSLIIGMISGYYGKKLDFLIMRLIEVLMSIPAFYLLLSLRNLFPIHLSSTYIYLILIILLSFISWAGFSRVIRNMVKSLKTSEYIIAAKVIGLKDSKIIIKHILPNLLGFIIVNSVLIIPFYIIGEITLSFLGIGIAEPVASLGTMLKEAQNIRNITDFPWVLSPGFAIFIIVYGYNLLGEGLRKRFNPKEN